MQKILESAEEFKREGMFVYELYAVMIHSGGAYGGHYYAYIKDAGESGKWHSFNDTQVKEISFLDIADMFGAQAKEAGKKYIKPRVFNHCNAYMLMYKLCQQQEIVQDEEISEEIMSELNENER